MKAAGVPEIKAELKNRTAAELLGICLRLARAKKENKELLSYLLFDAYDPDGYISQLKAEIDEALSATNRHNWYILKKQLRKVLSTTNKHLKFMASKAAEAEVLLHFCHSLHLHSIPVTKTIALTNLYEAQLKKAAAAIATLHEDLQYDLQQQLQRLSL
jgi:hypothetical protein